MTDDGDRLDAPHPGLDRLAKVTFAVESPVRRLVGSARLNPLPHAGTISVVLFGVVVVTGVYLTLFFEFGFEASYRSVEKLTAHPIQRFMRSLHRYSSAALVLTTLVHAWRILVAGRFNGPRRWRWLTGWSALLVVWVAGVTGYWLLWDERAQLLNEATAAVADTVGPLSPLVTAVMTADGTGWQVLLVIWLAHLLATAVIGWFLWRHLRRSKLPWLPPRLWTSLMLGALAVVSLVFPVELLERADLTRIVDSVPLDPFVLFLLPGFADVPGLVVVSAFVAASVLVAALPWVLERRPSPVVSIDAEACTGCELCVVDCPYFALSMTEEGGRAIAEVDEDACVACGICVGSCVFDAIELPGATLPDGTVESDHVVIVCDRLHRLGGNDDEAQILTVRCAGVVSPAALNDLVLGGATSVHVVGCPPGECVFGVGNRLAEERLAGTRRPRVPARSGLATTRDFVAPSALRRALATPGTHLTADPDSVPDRRWRLAGTAGLVVASAVVVGLATTLLWTTSRPRSEVMVVVHHRPGENVVGTGDASGRPGTPTILRTRVGDSAPTERLVGTGGLASAVVTVPAEPGTSEVDVELIEGSDRIVVHEGSAVLESGRRLVLTVEDRRDVDAEVGRSIFTSSVGGCAICHAVEPGIELVGPNLAGVAAVAGSRVPGMTAEEYLRESILDPDAYVVEGFPSGQMLDIYDESLTDAQVDALVAYLLSLDGGAS